MKLEESLFAQKKDELLDILKDIVTAIEENDYVLMNDDHYLWNNGISEWMPVRNIGGRINDNI